MTLQLTSVGGALTLALALIVLPGQASAQSGMPDCVRRVAPPSSSPHDVFRRTVYVCPDQTAAGPDSPQVASMPGRSAPFPTTSPAPARSAQAEM